MFLSSSAPKPHSAFSSYILSFSDRYGLHAITAHTETIHTSVYGTELASKFSELKDKLEKAYGKYDLFDYLMHDSIWNEPRDWMQAMLNKERSLAASWSAKHGSRLDNQLESIFLSTFADSSSEGHISLGYYFENHAAVVEEREQLEDDAL